ncbi:MAG TPA: PQQ-dependent sugar dehydrogenase, partial [Nitriliruptorales bacterium]|nr:PQQ-dependent sugar dehydrogenase [Nitriliruptorales bacterium]
MTLVGHRRHRWLRGYGVADQAGHMHKVTSGQSSPRSGTEAPTKRLRVAAWGLLLPFLASFVLPALPGGDGALAASKYDLRVSKALDRSAAGPLHGATVTGNAYVFTAPDTGVRRVSFWVDDPAMSGTPHRVEKGAPFDLAGTASDGTALPYDTTALSDGSHTVTAKVEPNKGTVEVVSATFTVNNTAPALTFTPATLSLSAAENGTPSLATTTVDTTDASTTKVALASSAAWLAVNPTSTGTPADVTVSADPAGLPPGTHTATVTATSPGYSDAVLGVTFTVVSSGGGYGLQLSRLPDRSSPVPLAGQTVAQNIFVFTAPDTNVTRVRFWLDSPSLSGTPDRTEKAAPFDLAGTASDGSAHPFDTTTLTDGSHTVSALLDLLDGTTVAAQASFTVKNDAAQIVATPSSLSFSVRQGDGPARAALSIGTSNGTAASFTATGRATWLTVSPATGTTPTELTVTADPAGLPSGTHTSSVTVTAPGYTDALVPVSLSVLAESSTYSLRYSTSPDRSAPVALHGATVAGRVHVFTTPDTSVSRVRFWIDDPATAGPPHSVESFSPFDLNGTAPDGTAFPYDTATLQDGNHTVTAVLHRTDGTTHVAEATFAVDNLPPGLAFNPTSLAFTLDVGGAAASQTATLNVDTGDPAAFTIQSNASWLTGSPKTGTAPTQITVTADPAGLGAGTYTGTLTASSSGMTSGTLSVTATVGDPGDCQPLACSEILVQLPYLLTFDQDHGKILDANSVGTGFTYVDPPTTGTGYLRSKLATNAGALAITTTAGLASGSSNSQDNALAVGIDAPSQVTVLSTTVLDLPAGTGNFEQAGLWFGNDQDNYVKLTAQSASTGPRVEFLMEVAGARNKAFQKNVVGLSGSDVTLKLKAVPADRTITASFSVNGGPFSTLGTVTAPGEFFSFDAAGIDPTIGTRSFGGVFASHRNGPAPLVYRFDDFSVTAALDEVVPTATAFDRVSFPVSFPTSMVWGPDNRLYVTELFGKIHAITLNQQKQVVADQVITTLGSRLTLGITVDPASTPSNVVLWVAHSNASLDNGQVNSSMVTRLSGSGFTTRQDVITGLPRALANHAINSIHFGPDGRLYIAQGGNTGAGAPNTANTEFGDRPEQPLSAALLVADVKAPGFEGSCATPLNTFGVPQTCDVAVYASGLRNTYDFVFHSNGNMYGPDNGLGVTGTYPPSPTPPCTGLADANLHNPGPQPDDLHLIEAGRYYGHPNPYRNECVFKDGRWQGVAAPPTYTPPIYDLGNNRSANGTIEYTGDAFCGGLRNEILITNYSVGDNITRIRLSADGRSVVASSSLVGGFKAPLPLV